MTNIKYTDSDGEERYSYSTHAGTDLDPDESPEQIVDAITTGNASLASIATAMTALNGYVDTLETLIAATNTGNTTLAGHVDGLETLLTATNAALATLQGYQDGVEALIGSTNTNLTTLAGYSDTLETLIAATNTALATLAGYQDGVETTLTAISGKLPATLGQKAMTASLAVTLASDQSAVESRQSWRVSTLSFTTADDSDNTFTVPATTEYQILSVYVSLVTTATVGNRQMAVQALDASDNILIGARAGATQAASLTRVYNFAPGMPQDTLFRDTDYLAVSMPPIFLAAGQKLRVWDKAAVAAAADDMTVRVQIASRSIA